MDSMKNKLASLLGMAAMFDAMGSMPNVHGKRGSSAIQKTPAIKKRIKAKQAARKARKKNR